MFHLTYARPLELLFDLTFRQTEWKIFLFTSSQNILFRTWINFLHTQDVLNKYAIMHKTVLNKFECWGFAEI